VQSRDPAWLRNSGLGRALIASPLFFAALLLLANTRESDRTHAYFGSVPLALAGIVFALIQLALRPPRTTLWKRLMLAATFVAWAVDQLLPAGPAAAFLGDMVISAYVLDLYWTMKEQIGMNRPVTAIACDRQAITAGKRPRYNDLFERLQRAIRERDEFPDGYAFRLDEKVIPPSEVAEWMAMERQCCPFLTLQLTAPQLTIPGSHEGWLLKLTGPAGAKTVLQSVFPVLLEPGGTLRRD
jgi:hypothetical protein